MRGADASTESQVPSISAPTISLPQGGGAIRGMGEKFAANPVTGTGSMTVPIATSPGRSGFGPQLSLTYDSGAGNGPFGFGWSLALPAIVRKTDKGLPRYRDRSSDPADADVFVLSGAEDLVPVFRCDANGDVVTDANGQPQIHEDTIDGYRVCRYRPRIEGLFARIERWQWIPTTTDPRPEFEQRADVHWRSISRDNILTIYGADANSRIADPEDPERIFSWLICETRDDKGNGLRYFYKAEDGVGAPLSQAHQRNRGAADDTRRGANRYIHRILYGNREPLLDANGKRPRRLEDLPDPPSDTPADWLFEVLFDYDQLDPDDPSGQPERPWRYRPDAFSCYRSGFEVRTCRRCERVLMLHHIPDQPANGGKGYEGVVRSTEFTYAEELDPTLATKPIYSFLKQVIQKGWKKENGITTRRSLPPLEFTYSQPEVQEQVEELDPGSLENLPIGLDGSSYQWVDLHGEGLPGILTEQAGQWFYKRNLSPVSQMLRAHSQAHVATFAAQEVVAARPNTSLAAGAQILDLAGDGQPDVVQFSGPAPGLYEHDGAEGWQPFRAFISLPTRDFRDPNLRFIDLNGDGHADLVISEADAFVWHPSLEEEGFGAAQRVALPWDEEQGPRVIFADGTESIHLADLSGDGLSDVVRIRNGKVCYWPNLGYGRFGAKVAMDNAPQFDHPELFDAKRLLLADIDGSGTTDLIYLHAEGVRLYFNQAGNSWSEAVQLQAFPPIHSAAQVTALDLLGNGTACLMWSSPLEGDGGRQMRYVPLMAEGKPHLLTTSINNLGAETRVQYCSSLRFYLEDKLAGKPWITRLPFPVQVVERVETIDHISRNCFISSYAYHHGYFDGKEREFRGFGMVEQWDTEEFATLAGGQAPPTNIAAESHVPPVHTKTWFHTGAYVGRDHVSDYFAGLLDAHDTGEYYRPPGLSDEQARVLLLDDTVLPEGLSAEEEREACRALKGSMLRQELYAEDGTAKAPHPYVITEQNFSIRQLQPAGTNRHGVFFTHPREAISCHSERNPNDPRITHALTLEVDAYGNVLKEAAIGYGRAEQVPVSQADGTPGVKPNPAKAELDDPDPAKSGLTQQDWYRQCLIHITYTENHLTNAVGDPADPGAPQPPPDAADTYRTPLPCRTSTYQLRRAEQDRSAPKYWIRCFSFEEIADRIAVADDGSHDIAYEDLDFRAAREAVEAGEADAEQSWRRLIEEVRILYRQDDLGSAAHAPGSTDDDPTALLPLGRLESLALPGETYKLALTPGLLGAVYRRRLDGHEEDEPLLPNPEAILPLPADPTTATPTDRGGYVDLDGDGRWWVPSGRIFYAPGGTDTAAAELAHARQHFFLPHRFRDPFHTKALSTERVVGYDIGDLLVTETRDPLGNRVAAVHDYRVLQPALVTDPNGNRSQVAFDTLGLVVGSAVMGKGSPAPVEGDSLEGFEPDLEESDIGAHLANPLDNPGAILGQASTRLVYDLFAYRRTKDQPQPAPPVIYTLARETHISNLGPNEQSRIQHAFSYSDGFGREIQKKVQAEPGPVPQRDAEGQVLHDACGRVLMTGEDIAPRWVASGWTIFNNKGKPVRQYEPFFSPTHGFEFGVRAGVSPILFYDPLGRVVATLHPNHTWEKVVFDTWRQDTWDVNDTVLTNPRTDDDIKGFFVQPDGTARLNEQDYLPLWHDLRTDPTHAAQLSTCYPDERLRNAEARAANQAAAHANTPSTAHLDALGRPFLTIARNRVQCPDHTLDGSEAAFATRVELDIEGNQREVIDAKDRVVMRYAYDLLGNRIHQASMEAGARWMLNDVAGNPIRAWDNRDHSIRTDYDPLRRPLRSFVTGADPANPTKELLTERLVYGEQHPQPERSNLRGVVHLHLDQAGATATEANDFKGNPLRASRRIAIDYKQAIDWNAVDAALPANAAAAFDPATLEAALVPVVAGEDQAYTSRTTYDALNRPVTLITPHTPAMQPSVIRPGYNEANLLERVDTSLRGATLNGEPDEPDWTPFVTNIDYDAKGQRQRIDYGNGVSTLYDYDPLTFRLTHLLTRRDAAAFPGDCPEPPRGRLARLPGAEPALHLRPGGQHHPHSRRCPADHLLQEQARRAQQ